MTKDELTNEMTELSKVADNASAVIDECMKNILTELSKIKTVGSDIRWVKSRLRTLDKEFNESRPGTSEPRSDGSTVGFSTEKAIGEYIHMRSIRHYEHY
jgi:uncharacterized coiled-coil DUF342 family protein